MAEDISHRIRKENSNINMDFTIGIYNEALIMIEDLRLEIANKVRNQLGMPSPNRSAAALFDVELRHEQKFQSNYTSIVYTSHNSRNKNKMELTANNLEILPKNG
ncbi:unnamed protein product [Onchocerca ochengi]|uniref:Uncharacterized protein n=1 Tax=Onchocerca ochengi TaxID=42157 RepID=A0A182E0E1_ONCOC|nr:unnamed protein product [Onchocerca ochengi]